jgi:multidrug efflux pump subunit AcrA (membrane-fusion protein)
VEVIFDAFPEEVFLGEIVTVSPIMETVSNINAIKALVLLDATSYAKPNPLPIGLSAQVDVIAGQTLDAVLLPVEALVEVSPEAYIVYVMENNLPRQRTVEVGLIDFTTAEIRSGLSAGETVVLGYGNQ